MTARIKDFPGTSLSETDFADKKVLFRHDHLEGRYAWDTGIAIGAYLAGLKRGVILGSHCRRCRKTVVPPRLVCEWCFEPMAEYVPLQDSGTVNTFSLCYVTWDVQRIKDPEIPAVIALDGGSQLSPASVVMSGIMHKLGNVEPKRVSIGMRVRAVWKPPGERQGAITDILFFEPM